MKLSADDRAGVRTLVLEMLAESEPHLAADSARLGLDHRDPGILEPCRWWRWAPWAAHQTYPRADDLWHDNDDDVRVAAAGVMVRLGGSGVRDRVSVDLGRLASASEHADRVVAARGHSGLVLGCRRSLVHHSMTC